MITYWRVVSHRHVEMTAVKHDDHMVMLQQLQTSAVIQELLHACRHVSLRECDAGECQWCKHCNLNMWQVSKSR